MRPIHLFIVGLLFLTATLLGLALLFFRTLPARASSATNIPAEDLQLATSTPAAETPSSLEPGSTVQHRVAAGEWLNQIVRCYGANYQEVRTVNPDLVDPELLLPATILTIPNIGSAGRVYGPPCITFHTVQSGDTWSSLAQKYDADIAILQAVNCVLEIGATLKIPLNSAGTPGSPNPPDPTEQIPLFSMSTGSPSLSYSGTVPPLGKVCLDLNASEARTLNIRVDADEDSAITVQKPDGAVLPRKSTTLSLSESVPQSGKYRVVIASTSRDAIIRYTMEANIKPSIKPSASVKATPTPGALRTDTPTPPATEILTLTPSPAAASPTTSGATPIRINFPAGQTTAVLAAVIDPNQTIHFMLSAAKGQLLSLSLTAPANQISIGVIGPTGDVLKPLDKTLTWSGTITTNGEYSIDIASMPGTLSQPFTLQVTLHAEGSVTEGVLTGTAVLVPSTPIPEPPLLIEVEWPKRLEVGRSDTIRVSLIRVSDKSYLPSVEVAGHTASVSTPISVGTPGVNPAAAMGPDYEAFAVAYLGAPAFQVSLTSSESQQLDQSRIDWTWTIISDQANPQVLTVTIEVHWKPRSGSGGPIQRVLWRSSPPLDIDVYQPLITTGQLSLFTLLSGSVGSGLSIPFLYGILKERGKKTQQKPKRKARSG